MNVHAGLFHSLPIALTLALLPNLDAQAPAPPTPDGEEVQEEAKEARFEKRLVHLRDGRILRVRARAADGDALEIKQGRERYVLPAAAIERNVLERDVLAESRKLRKEAGRKDPVRRTMLAAWMFEQGLFEEGIDELNPVLTAHPDHPEALALLERNPPPLALPAVEPDAASVTSFLRRVAGARPVSREVAVQRLGELHGRIDLRATLRVELAGSSLRRRAFAALALRRLFPGQEVKALLNRAVLDGSGDVRAEASRALAAVDDPAVMLPVLKALGSSSSAVRANAAEALGNMSYPHAVPQLVTHLTAVNSIAASGGGYRPPASNIYVGRQIAYVQDYDVEVAQGSAIADPVVNTLTEGAVLDVRVLGVTQTQIASEKAAVRTALAKLTGAKPGHTTKAWTTWWEKNGTEWLAGLSSPDPASPTSPGR